METYCLDRDILSIHSEPDHARFPMTIPAGAVVTTTDGVLDGMQMIDVIWQGKMVKMFAFDLRTRAKRIATKKSSVS